MADPVTAIIAAKTAYEAAKVAGKRAQDILCTDTMKQGIVMAIFSQRDKLQTLKALLCSPESDSTTIFNNIVAALTSSKGFPRPIRELIQNNPNFFIRTIETFKKNPHCTRESLENPEKFKSVLNNLVGMMCSKNTNELKQKYGNLRKSMNTSSMLVPSNNSSLLAPVANTSMNLSLAPNPNTTGGKRRYRKTRRHSRKTRKTKRHSRK
jgi:hypothetical protein